MGAALVLVAAAAPRFPPAPPPRGGMVTFPAASTMVLPVGSGKEPCRYQAGEPFSAGPRVGGTVCADAPTAARVVNKATKGRPLISVPLCLGSRAVADVCGPAARRTGPQSGDSPARTIGSTPQKRHAGSPASTGSC